MAGLDFGCDISLHDVYQLYETPETAVDQIKLISRLREEPGPIQSRARPCRKPRWTV